MTNDDETTQILPDQSLQILTIFPKRTIDKVSLHLPSFVKLFDLLCCPICRQLLHNPVYLKCSHRFCKECIERYIRCSKKKSCPICRGILTTRRDLRPDHNIQQLINMAFGNPYVLEQKLNRIETIQFQRLTGNQPEKIQVKSKKRGRRPLIQNEDAYPHGVKKIKTNNGQQIRLKGQETSPSITTICVAIQKQEQEYQKHFGQSKNNKEQTCALEKNNTQESREFSTNRFVKCVSISVAPQAQSKCITNLTPTQNIISQNQQKKTNQQKNTLTQHPSFLQSSKKQKRQQLPVSTTSQELPPSLSPIQNAKITLRQQFGQDYLYKLVEHSKTTIYIQFQIQKHPLNLFTPNLQFSNIQIPANYPLYKLSYIISKQLNIHPDAIHFYLKNLNHQNLQQITKKQVLLQVAKTYWQTKKIFSLCDLSEMIDKMSSKSKNLPTQQHHKIKTTNVLYFSIDHRRLVPR